MASGHLWINEKRFNKSGRVGGKTLIGNWHEEQRLEIDVGLLPGTHIDTNRKGAESTPFLISSLPRHNRSMTSIRSEHHAEFNEDNSDVTLLRPPKLGVRSMLRAQAILDEAKAHVKVEEQRRLRVEHNTLRSTQADAHLSTGVAGPPVKIVDPTKELSYHRETPITVYTGDPTTKSVMPSVPGRTPAGHGAPNTLAKTHAFTMDKYVHALSRQ